MDLSTLTDDELIKRQVELYKRMNIAGAMASGSFGVFQAMLEEVEMERSLRLSTKMWDMYLDNTKPIITTEDGEKTDKKPSNPNKKTIKRIDSTPIIKTSTPACITKKD